MASPQLEDGYMMIATEIVDNLCKLPLNGTEQKVLWCIFRYTFGFHRKSHSLSASFIARWGNCDISSVKRALKKLQEEGIIVCVNPQKKGVTAELMFNKDYETWKETGGRNDTGSKNATGGRNDTGLVAKTPPELVAELPPKIIKKENINLKNKYYELFFEKVWQAYPKKKGKSAVSKKAKKELYEAGEEMVLGAIQSYKREIEANETEDRFIMHGSTFFNGRWRDFIQQTKEVEDVRKQEEEKSIDYSSVERKW